MPQGRSPPPRKVFSIVNSPLLCFRFVTIPVAGKARAGCARLMISLQKLFGKSDIFYELLEMSAEEGRNSVLALKKLLTQATGPAEDLDEFILSRRKDKRITERINEELCRTFVTELDREDIEALSNALYRIPKTVEKIAERYLICKPYLREADFTKHLKMMEDATSTVVEITRQLSKKLHLEKIRDQNSRLQHIEGQADKHILDLFREIYSGKHEPLQAMMQRDLYELMEKVIDRCRDAGNVVAHIVLKYT